MYTLTLTREERKAIDWIGGRYAHGDELAKVLMASFWSPDGAEWDGVEEITFGLSEPQGWEVKDIIDRDVLACFSHILAMKLMAFADKIV